MTRIRLLLAVVLAGCGSSGGNGAPTCEADSFSVGGFSVLDTVDVTTNSNELSPGQLERGIKLTLELLSASLPASTLHVVLLDTATIGTVCPAGAEGCQIGDTIYYRYSGPCVGRSALAHEFGHWFKRVTTGDPDGAHVDDAFFGLKDYENSVVGKVHAQLQSEFHCACELSNYVERF